MPDPIQMSLDTDVELCSGAVFAGVPLPLSTPAWCARVRKLAFMAMTSGPAAVAAGRNWRFQPPERIRRPGDAGRGSAYATRFKTFGNA